VTGEGVEGHGPFAARSYGGASGGGGGSGGSGGGGGGGGGGLELPVKGMEPRRSGKGWAGSKIS